MITAAAILYVVGVVVGLLRVDASPVMRIVVALLWPVGALAGVITVTGLLLAAMVLFPMVGAALVIAAGVVWLVAAGSW